MPLITSQSLFKDSPNPAQDRVQGRQPLQPNVFLERREGRGGEGRGGEDTTLGSDKIFKTGHQEKRPRQTWGSNGLLPPPDRGVSLDVHPRPLAALPNSRDT